MKHSGSGYYDGRGNNENINVDYHYLHYYNDIGNTKTINNARNKNNRKINSCMK